MKKLFILSLLLFITAPVMAQRKTKNIIVITVDGFRWQDLFRGADSAKLFKRSLLGQDSIWKINNHWSPTVKERRERLMSFFWNTIAKHGQIYSNRDFNNFCSFQILTPGGHFALA